MLYTISLDYNINNITIPTLTYLSSILAYLVA